MREKKTMKKVAEEALAACTKDNGCLMYPVFNQAGYATCYIGRVKRSLARVVLCVHTNKPIDYTENGVRMEAGHLSQFVCYGRNCIKPEHLVWQTPEQNAQQREAEELLRSHEGWGFAEANINFIRKLLSYARKR